LSEETFCIDLRDKENTANFAARVWRAGESLVITIPRAYAETLKLKEGDIVDAAIRVLKRVHR
jgi:bifunctional DNA-binding transcriptional regulator/antitoxin component of YhaV-PrlF toxin-antitoxin module